MKVLMSLIVMILSLSAQAQGLILSDLAQKPDFLSLEVTTNSFSGTRIHHSEIEPNSNTKIMIQVSFNHSPFLQQVGNRIKSSNYQKIYCDGEYELRRDRQGVTYIDLIRIKACINEHGFLIAADPRGNEIPAVIAGRLYSKIMQSHKT